MLRLSYYRAHIYGCWYAQLTAADSKTFSIVFYLSQAVISHIHNVNVFTVEMVNHILVVDCSSWNILHYFGSRVCILAVVSLFCSCCKSKK